MKTDVRETEDTYEVDIDLPGFKKDEIKVDLKDGYLTISAEKNLNRDEKDQKGNYIRQERCTGACSRSFYVGDIRPEHITAKYEDGYSSAVPCQRWRRRNCPAAAALPSTETHGPRAHAKGPGSIMLPGPFPSTNSCSTPNYSFQSPPPRGKRRWLAVPSVWTRQFQPTPPWGGLQGVISAVVQRAISIHAPREGSDWAN